MEDKEEYKRLMRGNLVTLAPSEIADKIGELISSMTGDKYDCTITEISYKHWDAKINLELNRQLDSLNK